MNGAKGILLTLAFLTFSISVYAQISINGVVYDSQTKLPLQYVTIQVLNSSIGTVTDSLGKCSLTAPEYSSLIISHVDYRTDTVNLQEYTNFVSYLKENKNTYKDKPVTITGRSINLRLPAPLMQIFPEHLKRDYDVTIAPALNRVSGVFMHSGALNTNRITIRGIGNRSPFSTTKIRAYLDDIPLTSGDGETAIEDIDMSLIQQVDVWKGPTASVYGAGLGGMLHLKTGELELGDSNIGSALTVGSYGLVRNESQVNYSDTKNGIQLGFKYNTTHSDGYRENNAYDRNGGLIVAKFVSEKLGQTTLIGNLISLKAFIPSSLNEEDYRENPQKAAFTWNRVMGFEDYNRNLFGLSHQMKLHSFENHVLQNRTSLFTTSRNSYESRPFNILDEKSTSIGLRSTFEYRSKKRNNHMFPTFVLGAEVFREKYDWQTFQTNDGEQGDILSDNNEIRKYINLFAQSYVSINNKLTLFSGLNFNSTSYDYLDVMMSGGVDKSGEYTFDGVLSPHLGLNYHFDYSLALFATVSHGFSPPSLSETLTPDGTINPEIAPEKGWNFELGSRGRIDSRFTYEVTAYSMQIRDLLVARRVSEDQFIGANAGKTEHNGLEVFLEYQAVGSKSLSILPFVTYTFSDFTFKDFVDDTNDYSGNDLTGSPPHQLNVGVDMSSDLGPYAHFNYRFVDAFPMRDDNSIYSESYQVVNMKVGYKKRLFEKLELDFSFGIRNLFDEQYASMILINAGSFGGNAPRYYYPGLPRNYYSSLSLKYNINALSH